MAIVVVGKPNCIFCTQAKELLDLHNISYQYLSIGDDIDLGDVKTLYPTATTVPIVVIDNEYIGGFTELKEQFNNGVL